MTPSHDTTERSAPTLETERLRLRGFRRDDLDDLATMLGDPRVTEHFGSPATREDAWRKLMMAVGQWPLLGFGYWMVEPRGGGAMLGQVGFGIFERGLVADYAGLPEMGWIFNRAAQGQGLAFEAAQAALGWLNDARGCGTTWAIIAPDNMPSLKLATKLGFEREGDRLYHDEPIAILRRP